MKQDDTQDFQNFIKEVNMVIEAIRERLSREIGGYSKEVFYEECQKELCTPIDKESFLRIYWKK